MTATELRQQRAKLIADCRKVVEAAKAAGRDINAEEEASIDKMMNEAQALKSKYERLEQVEAAEADLAASQGRTSPAPRPGQHARGDGASTPYSFQLRGRTITLQPGTAAWQRHQPAYRSAFSAWLGQGQIGAALQTDSDTAGGYLTVPEQFIAEMIKNLDDAVWIRSLARTFTTTAQSIGAPKRTAKFNAFNWGSELSNAEDNADAALKFGKRSLTPHYMTGSILISRDLLRSAVMDPDQIVQEEMNRDAGETEEEAFLTGNGAGQPLGLFTASNDGISTSRDVSTGNTTTAIKADNLRECKYALKETYRRDPSLRWLGSRAWVKQVSLLKDGEGQYLWQTGITESDPDRVLGIGVVESEFAPSTFTTGLYVAMLGAFRNYWIVDSLTMDMQRLVETYAKTNQVQIIARRKVDGAPQVEEAFVRQKLA